MRTFVWICNFVLLLEASNAFLTQSHRGPRGVASPERTSGPRSTAASLSTSCLSATKKAAAKTKSSAPKKEVENFKKAEFVAALADRTGVTKKEADASLQAVLDIVQEQISQGKKIAFPGFGSFTLKDRAERKGRNPQTGEDILIPASKSPAFTVSKTWKDAINGK